MCPSENELVCQSDWELPLILFIDSNNNKQRDIEEEIINRFTPYPQLSRSITYPRKQIRFNGLGQINGYTGTLIYCSELNSKGIVLSRVGRIRYSEEDKCS